MSNVTSITITSAGAEIERQMDRYDTVTQEHAFVTGQLVTVWPRVSPGESRDTEPGLQPWPAEFVGYTTDGRAIIKTGEARYATGAYRVMDLDGLR